MKIKVERKAGADDGNVDQEKRKTKGSTKLALQASTLFDFIK